MYINCEKILDSQSKNARGRGMGNNVKNGVEREISNV